MLLLMESERVMIFIVRKNSEWQKMLHFLYGKHLEWEGKEITINLYTNKVDQTRSKERSSLSNFLIFIIRLFYIIIYNLQCSLPSWSQLSWKLQRGLLFSCIVLHTLHDVLAWLLLKNIWYICSLRFQKDSYTFMCRSRRQWNEQKLL